MIQEAKENTGNNVLFKKMFNEMLENYGLTAEDFKNGITPLVSELGGNFHGSLFKLGALIDKDISTDTLLELSLITDDQPDIQNNAQTKSKIFTLKKTS